MFSDRDECLPIGCSPTKRQHAIWFPEQYKKLTEASLGAGRTHGSYLDKHSPWTLHAHLLQADFCPGIRFRLARHWANSGIQPTESATLALCNWNFKAVQRTSVSKIRGDAT